MGGRQKKREIADSKRKKRGKEDIGGEKREEIKGVKRTIVLVFSLVHIPYVLAVCEAVVCKSLGETIHSGTLTKTHTHIHKHTCMHTALWAELPGVWESSGVPCMLSNRH